MFFFLVNDQRSDSVDQLRVLASFFFAFNGFEHGMVVGAAAFKVLRGETFPVVGYGEYLAIDA